MSWGSLATNNTELKRPSVLSRTMTCYCTVPVTKLLSFCFVFNAQLSLPHCFNDHVSDPCRMLVCLLCSWVPALCDSWKGSTDALRSTWTALLCLTSCVFCFVLPDKQWFAVSHSQWKRSSWGTRLLLKQH